MCSTHVGRLVARIQGIEAPARARTKLCVVSLIAVISLSACESLVPTTGTQADNYYTWLKEKVARGELLHDFDKIWIVDYETANPRREEPRAAVEPIAVPFPETRPPEESRAPAPVSPPPVKPKSAAEIRAEQKAAAAQEAAERRRLAQERAEQQRQEAAQRKQQAREAAVARSGARVAPTSAAPARPAGAGTDGRYALEGGSYIIDVTFGPGTLTVTEPNKVSVYQQQSGSRRYIFTNPTNGITYGLQVADDTTLEAFKPGSDAPATQLKLVSSPAVQRQLSADTGRQNDIANRYLQRSRTDPKNVHVWSACAAAASERSRMPGAAADDYAKRTAESLKPIMTNAARTPCPDAIPAAIWNAAN